MIGFVGPHVTVLPEESLAAAPAVDFVVRREIRVRRAKDSKGQALWQSMDVTWRDGDTIRHNDDAEFLEDMDSLPFVVDVYQRDLTIENYFIGYLMHPYMSFYTGRGCPARCTYCLWPQTIGTHKFSTRSVELVYQEVAMAKKFPQVKEFFFDDDTSQPTSSARKRSREGYRRWE